MKNFSKVLILGALLAFGCSGQDVKEKINMAGDVAGQAVGEFASGVSSGVSKAFDAKIELSEKLTLEGVTFGKTTVSSDSGASDNLLTVYVIFNKSFSGSLTAKAFDNKGVEMGRVKLEVDGKQEEAKYLDFHFDKRTNIDADSRLTIE